MTNKIRIRAAVELAKSRGEKIKKNELARKVFPGTTDKSATVCLNNYELGKSTKMDRLQIVAISEALGCDANLLFGTPPMSNINTQKENEDGKSDKSGGKGF